MHSMDGRHNALIDGQMHHGGGHTAGSQGQMMTGQGQMMTGQGQMMTGQGQMMIGQGQMMTGQGQMMTGQGKMMTGQGQMMTGQGQMQSQIITGQGQMMTGQGQMISGQSQMMTGQTMTGHGQMSCQGQVMTGQGQMVTGQGQMANAKHPSPATTNQGQIAQIPEQSAPPGVSIQACTSVPRQMVVPDDQGNRTMHQMMEHECLPCNMPYTHHHHHQLQQQSSQTIRRSFYDDRSYHGGVQRMMVSQQHISPHPPRPHHQLNYFRQNSGAVMMTPTYPSTMQNPRAWAGGGCGGGGGGGGGGEFASGIKRDLTEVFVNEQRYSSTKYISPPAVDCRTAGFNASPRLPPCIEGPRYGNTVYGFYAGQQPGSYADPNDPAILCQPYGVMTQVRSPWQQFDPVRYQHPYGPQPMSVYLDRSGATVDPAFSKHAVPMSVTTDAGGNPPQRYIPGKRLEHFSPNVQSPPFVDVKPTCASRTDLRLNDCSVVDQSSVVQTVPTDNDVDFSNRQRQPYGPPHPPMMTSPGGHQLRHHHQMVDFGGWHGGAYPSPSNPYGRTTMTSTLPDNQQRWQYPYSQQILSPNSYRYAGVGIRNEDTAKASSSWCKQEALGVDVGFGFSPGRDRSSSRMSNETATTGRDDVVQNQSKPDEMTPRPVSDDRLPAATLQDVAVTSVVVVVAASTFATTSCRPMIKSENLTVVVASSAQVEIQSQSNKSVFSFDGVSASTDDARCQLFKRSELNFVTSSVRADPVVTASGLTYSGHCSLPSGHSSISSGHSNISSGHSDMCSGHSSISSGHSDMPTGYCNLSSGHLKAVSSRESEIVGRKVGKENSSFDFDPTPVLTSEREIRLKCRASSFVESRASSTTSARVVTQTVATPPTVAMTTSTAASTDLLRCSLTSAAERRSTSRNSKLVATVSSRDEPSEPRRNKTSTHHDDDLNSGLTDTMHTSVTGATPESNHRDRDEINETTVVGSAEEEKETSNVCRRRFFKTRKKKSKPTLVGFHLISPSRASVAPSGATSVGVVSGVAAVKLENSNDVVVAGGNAATKDTESNLEIHDVQKRVKKDSAFNEDSSAATFDVENKEAFGNRFLRSDKHDETGNENLSVTVPFGWKRVRRDNKVFYHSPTNVELKSVDELRHYLLREGTCKCGLQCPLILEKVFIFDVDVESRHLGVDDVRRDSDMTNLCNHKRKIVAMATFQHSAGLHMNFIDPLHYRTPATFTSTSYSSSSSSSSSSYVFSSEASSKTPSTSTGESEPGVELKHESIVVSVGRFQPENAGCTKLGLLSREKSTLDQNETATMMTSNDACCQSTSDLDLSATSLRRPTDVTDVRSSCGDTTATHEILISARTCETVEDSKTSGVSRSLSFYDEECQSVPHQHGYRYESRGGGCHTSPPSQASRTGHDAPAYVSTTGHFRPQIYDSPYYPIGQFAGGRQVPYPSGSVSEMSWPPTQQRPIHHLGISRGYMPVGRGPVEPAGPSGYGVGPFDPLWPPQSGVVRSKGPGPRAARKRRNGRRDRPYSSMLERSIPCPNIDVRQIIQDQRDRIHIEAVSDRPASSSTAGVDGLAAFLAHQTVLVNRSLPASLGCSSPVERNIVATAFEDVASRRQSSSSFPANSPTLSSCRAEKERGIEEKRTNSSSAADDEDRIHPSTASSSIAVDNRSSNVSVFHPPETYSRTSYINQKERSYYGHHHHHHPTQFITNQDLTRSSGVAPCDLDSSVGGVVVMAPADRIQMSTAVGVGSYVRPMATGVERYGVAMTTSPRCIVDPTRSLENDSSIHHLTNKDDSPIRLVQNMVSGLVTTQNSLAMVTSMIVSRGDASSSRRRKSIGGNDQNKNASNTSSSTTADNVATIGHVVVTTTGHNVATCHNVAPTIGHNVATCDNISTTCHNVAATTCHNIVTTTGQNICETAYSVNATCPKIASKADLATASNVSCTVVSATSNSSANEESTSQFQNVQVARQQLSTALVAGPCVAASQAPPVVEVVNRMNFAVPRTALLLNDPMNLVAFGGHQVNLPRQSVAVHTGVAQQAQMVVFPNGHGGAVLAIQPTCATLAAGGYPVGRPEESVGAEEVELLDEDEDEEEGRVDDDDDDLMRTTGTQTSTPASSNFSNCNSLDSGDNEFLFEGVVEVGTEQQSVSSSTKEEASSSSADTIVGGVRRNGRRVSFPAATTAGMPAPLQQVSSAAVVVPTIQHQPTMVLPQGVAFAGSLPLAGHGYLQLQQPFDFGFDPNQVGLIHFGQMVNAGGNVIPSHATLIGNAGVIPPMVDRAPGPDLQSYSQNLQTKSDADHHHQQQQQQQHGFSAGNILHLMSPPGHILVQSVPGFVPFAGALVPVIQQSAFGATTVCNIGGTQAIFAVGAPGQIGIVVSSASGVVERSSTNVVPDAPDSTVDSEDIVPSNVSDADSVVTTTTTEPTPTVFVSAATSRSRSFGQRTNVSAIVASVDEERNTKDVDDTKTMKDENETDVRGEVCSPSGSSLIELRTTLDDRNRLIQDSKETMLSSCGIESAAATETATVFCASELSVVGDGGRSVKIGGRKRSRRFKNNKRRKPPPLRNRSFERVEETETRNENEKEKKESELVVQVLNSDDAVVVVGEEDDRSKSEDVVTTMTSTATSVDCRVTTTHPYDSSDSTIHSRIHPSTMTTNVRVSRARTMMERARNQQLGFPTKNRHSMKRTHKESGEDKRRDYVDDADSTTSLSSSVSYRPSAFNVGDLVWGPMRGFPSWPGKLVSETEVRGGHHKTENGKIWVRWFGDHSFTQEEPEQLKTLSEGLDTHHNARKKHRKGRKMNANLEAAIQEAMTELDRQMDEEQSRQKFASGTTTEKLSKHFGAKKNKK